MNVKQPLVRLDQGLFCEEEAGMGHAGQHTLHWHERNLQFCYEMTFVKSE